MEQKGSALLEDVRELMATHPSWCRTRLSEQLCRKWNWYTPAGRLKDMACRTFLLKLERSGRITLPLRRGRSTNGFRNRNLTEVAHITDEINCHLKQLVPLQVKAISHESDELRLFKCLLAKYHYLSHRNTVGENIKYLVRDCGGRPLACLLFGSAAWKSAARDTFIGWQDRVRRANLSFVTNNTRFLILPWVTVSCLASHVLAAVCRRLNSDWHHKYGHPIYLIETFVDTQRHQGTCYRAANWILTGQTKGRTRNDRKHTIQTSAKDVYLYPLIKNFKHTLCHPVEIQ